MWRWITNESGQAGTEYALIIVSLIVCVLVMFETFTEEIRHWYGYIIDKLRIAFYGP